MEKDSRLIALRFWLALIAMLCCSVAFSAPAQPPFYMAQKGDVIVYVLGTSGNGKKEDYPLSADILDALNSSRFVTEISAAEMAKDEPIEFLCPDACLPDYMSASQWKWLVKKRKIEKQPGQRDLWERMSPFFFMFWIAEENNRAAGLSNDQATVKWLRSQYQATYGEEVGLETLAEEIARVSRLSEAAKYEMTQLTLKQMKKSPTKQLRDAERSYQAWRKGDIDAILHNYQQVRKDLKNPSVFLEIDSIRIDRSQKFAQRLQPLLSKDRPVFFAVDAGLLAGKDGLLHRLEEQGFTVSRR